MWECTLLSASAPPCSQTMLLRQTPPTARRWHRARPCQAASTEAVRSSLQRRGGAAEGKPAVLIAGAGIGGLVLGLGLLKKGFPVQLLERDLTAVRGEGKYRGPIQIQSNALAALEALDATVAERILAEGCITGDRVNGLVDGESGKWYVKFDTFHPAVDRGLPVTRVIGRTTLQAHLADACTRLGGDAVIQNNVNVVSYAEGEGPDGAPNVTATASDGRTFTGDILIGADGIWSKVRKQLIGDTDPSYSQYTCYTGIANFTPPDIDTVGYRVFLGNGKYFVSSDVGDGRMQWYGFHKEPAGGQDAPGTRRARLLRIFGHWTDMVTDLIQATPEEDVLRRDIYDRPPIFKWAEGRVALLGDSAHAMQPNLGQGGCMAIEDGYTLAVDLLEAVERAAASGQALSLPAVLKAYERKRLLRVSTIHGLAGSAAIMASTYKAHLGEGLGPIGKWFTKFKVPHPGRVGGYFAMNLTMPTVLAWVLGGNLGAFRAADRASACRLGDKPRAFADEDFGLFLRDDRALLRAARARWLLVPGASRRRLGDEAGKDDEALHRSFLRIALPDRAVDIGAGLTVGSGEGCDVRLSAPEVEAQHLRVERDAAGERSVTALAGRVWLNGAALAPGTARPLTPGDLLEVGRRDAEEQQLYVKLAHDSVWEQLRGPAASQNGAGPGAKPAPEPQLALASS